MSIMIPDGLAKLFSGLTGMSWPQADEDKLRQAGDDYLTVATDMPQLRQYIADMVSVCTEQFEGQAADAFVDLMRKLIGQSGGDDYLGQAGDQAKELAKCAHDTANQVEYAKWMTIAQLVQLAFEIAWAIAWAPFTGGASLGEIVAARLIAEGILRKIFAWLIDQIAMHVFMGVVGGVALDAIIQMLQIAEGHKSWSDWDTKSTLQAVEFGALSGLVGGPLDLLGHGIGKLFSNTIGKGLGKSGGRALGDELGNLGNNLAKDLGKDGLGAGAEDLFKDGLGAGFKDGFKDGLGDGARNDLTDLAGKDLGNGAGRDLGKDVGNGIGDEAGNSAGRDVGKDVGNEAGSGLGRGAGEEAGSGLGKDLGRGAEQVVGDFAEHTGGQWLGKDAAKAFGQDLGNTLGKHAGGFGEKFAQDLGADFEKHLGGLIGGDAARDLGQDFAKALAEGAGRGGEEAFLTGLTDTLGKDGLLHGDAVNALVNSVPGLMKKIGGDTVVFKLGAAVGNYLKSGVHNSLTEGFYNLTFGDDHTFSMTWQTFVSGVGMGALGHLGHHLTEPIKEKWTDFVGEWLHDPEATGKYYPPTHPLTILSILSNLAGHHAPIPVMRPQAPRPRPEEEGTKVRTVGGDGTGSSRDERPAPPGRIKVEGGSGGTGGAGGSKQDEAISAPQRQATVGGGGDQEHQLPAYEHPPAYQEHQQPQTQHEEQPQQHQVQHVEPAPVRRTESGPPPAHQQQPPVQHVEPAPAQQHVPPVPATAHVAPDRVFVADPGLSPQARERFEQAVARFPRDDRHFTVAMHVGDQGPVPPHQLADRLRSALADGSWDGVKPIKFVACDLAHSLDGQYVTSVLDDLAKSGVHTSALAPDGPVWFEPRSGRLLVASQVGYDHFGLPVVVEGGSWHEYRPGEPEPIGLGSDLPADYREVEPGELHQEAPNAVAFGRRNSLARPLEPHRYPDDASDTASEHGSDADSGSDTESTSGFGPGRPLPEEPEEVELARPLHEAEYPEPAGNPTPEPPAVQPAEGPLRPTRPVTPPDVLVTEHPLQGGSADDVRVDGTVGSPEVPVVPPPVPVVTVHSPGASTVVTEHPLQGGSADDVRVDGTVGSPEVPVVPPPVPVVTVHSPGASTVVTEHPLQETVPGTAHDGDGLQQHDGTTVEQPVQPQHPPQPVQPAVPPPLPPRPSRPPVRAGRPGLAAYDVITELHVTDRQTREQLTDHFAGMLGGDRAAADSLVGNLFGVGSVRPRLAGLSRGEDWEVPFSAGNWSGTVRLRADVVRQVFQERRATFEFEIGSEQQSVTGTTADRQWQVSLAAASKFKFGSSGDLTETLGYQHGWQDGESSADASRTIARGKTVEPAALFRTDFALHADFTSLTHHGVEQARPATPRTVHYSGTVAVPDRETRPQPPATEYRSIPRQVLEQHRLGGSHLVTDVWTLGPDADGGPRGAAKLIGGFEEDGRQVAGRLWDHLKAKVLSEVSLQSLHQDLKSLMAGQSFGYEVHGLDGSVARMEFTRATVRTLEQDGTAGTTEFNIGTGNSSSQVKQHTDSDGAQLPFVGSGNYTGKSPGIAGGGAGAQLGRDDVTLSGSGEEVSLTSKTKSPAVVFDGEAELTVRITHRGPLGGRLDGLAPERLVGPAERTVRAGLGFRALVDHAETAAVPLERGKPVFRAADGPAQPPAEPGRESYPAPPNEVWSGEPGVGGLPDTTTVRDLVDVSELHRRIDAWGRRELGEQDWSEVREEVLAAYSHAAVAAHLTSMTRQVPLHAPEVTRGPLKDLHISATASVTRMRHLRSQESSDLNPVRESTTFESRRKLRSDSKSGQLQGGGTVLLHTEPAAEGAKALKDTLDITPTAGLEHRVRDGQRSGESTKSYQNGKYRSAQELYDTSLTLNLDIVHKGVRHPLSVDLRAELGLERRLVEQHRLAAGLERPAEFTAPVVGPARPPERPAHPLAPPARTRQGRLASSDVLLDLGSADSRVLARAKAILADRLGELPGPLQAKLARELSPDALKAQLVRLTQGKSIRIPVEHGGWRGDVVLHAGVTGLRHTQDVAEFEFELGGQQRSSTGFSWDRRTRTKFKFGFKATAPHFTGSADRTRTRDSVSGLTVDHTGGTNSRGKSTEPAAVFDGTAQFRISFEPQRGSHRLAGDSVPVPARVAIPVRDVTPTVTRPRRVPDRVAAGHRLGSSDIVTEIRPPHPPAGGGPEARQLVQQITSDGRGRLGRDWPGMSRKIEQALDLDRLRPQLKSLMSGHEIVLQHGRSTVRIRAELAELEQVGEAPKVEFNIGTTQQTALTGTDGGVNTGSGKGNSTSINLQGTSDPLGAGPAVVAGLGGSHGRGSDQVQQHSESASTAAGVKTKLPATASHGTARLVFTMERRPLVRLVDRDRIAAPGSLGARLVHVAGYRRGRTTADLHVEVLSEADHNPPVDVGGAHSLTQRADELAHHEPPVRTGAVQQQALRRPPEEVFRTGLRQQDVLRWLGDSSGVQDLLRSVGPSFFGNRTWKRLGDLAAAAHSHAQLSADFTEAGNGWSHDTPSAGRRLLRDDAGVSATVNLVSLEYEGDSRGAELSPGNEVSAGGRRLRLDWSLWSGQAQLGAKAEVSETVGNTTTVTAGLAHTSRAGASSGGGGRVPANAKFPEPMARYTGYAKVELTFRDGDRQRTESGLVPVEVELPVSRTTPETLVDTYRRSYQLHPDTNQLHTVDHPVFDSRRTDAVATALAAGHRNDTVDLTDPAAPPEQAARFRQAIDRFPHDPAVFTLGYHTTRPDGAPTWNGRRLSPRELAISLADLHDRGIWPQGRPLRFVACGSGHTPEQGRSYAAQVLRELRTRRPDLGPLEAYAPNGPVWFFPARAQHPGEQPHLVVSQHVGYDAYGFPRVTPGGHWQHLTLPDGETEPHAADLPADHGDPNPLPPATADQPITRPAPEAVRFGDQPPPDHLARTPLAPADWERIRALAPPGVMHSERFDPLRAGQAGKGPLAGPSLADRYRDRRPELGGLTGYTTAIRYDLRHFEAAPGHWVKEFTLRLHLDPGTGHDALTPDRLDRLWQRTRDVVDREFNGRFTLPDGSQAHLRLERADSAAGAHQTVSAKPGDGGSDQRNWFEESGDGVLLHEVLHHLGLPDEYAAERTVFRSGGRMDQFAGDHGVMGDAAHRAHFEVLSRHLAKIDEVSRSGPLVRELTHDQFVSLEQRKEHRAAAAPHHPADGGTEDSTPHEAAAAPPLNTIMVQPAYASGDQFGIAAMLMKDSARPIVITWKGDEQRKAETIAQFYRDSGIAADRIRVVEDEPAALSAVYNELHQGFDGLSGRAKKNVLLPVGAATTYIGKEFDSDLRRDIRRNWGLDRPAAEQQARDGAIADWLAGKGVRLPAGTGEKPRVAVLWSRFSGKGGEVHIEHDTSYHGMAQIIAGLKDFDAVVIVGDKAPKVPGAPAPAPEELRKFETISRSYSDLEHAPEFNPAVVDLTEFWKDAGAPDWGGDTRTGQFGLFDYLDRHATARHLGFRSGNLEAMALMGFEVRYMEEPHSVIGGARMEAWHEQDAGLTATGGETTGYERLRVSAPPTRSGDYQKSLPLDEQKGAQKHADWHKAADRRAAKLDDQGSSRPKGFSAEDLANIDGYLRHGDSAHGLPQDLRDQVKQIAADYRKAKPPKQEVSDQVLSDLRQRFGALHAQYGRRDALRARNLFASNLDHLLPSELAAPSDWLAERSAAPVNSVDSAHGGYQVRSFTTRAGRPVTEFTLRIDLVDGTGRSLGPGAAHGSFQHAADLADRHFNGRFTLPDGSQAHLKLEHAPDGQKVSAQRDGGPDTPDAEWSPQRTPEELLASLARRVGLPEGVTGILSTFGGHDQAALDRVSEALGRAARGRPAEEFAKAEELPAQAPPVRPTTSDDIFEALTRPTTPKPVSPEPTATTGGKRRAEEPPARQPEPKRQYDRAQAQRSRNLVEPTEQEHRRVRELAAARPPHSAPDAELLSAITRDHRGPNCGETVEAYRDTWYGRGRAAALLPGAEPESGFAWALLKLHNEPLHYGADTEGFDAVHELVRRGGPGSFATVLAGDHGRVGHDWALVHTADGRLLWVDVHGGTSHPAEPGRPPGQLPPGTKVWASVTDGQQHRLTGPGQHDPHLLLPDPEHPEARFGAPATAPAHLTDWQQALAAPDPRAVLDRIAARRPGATQAELLTELNQRRDVLAHLGAQDRVTVVVGRTDSHAAARRLQHLADLTAPGQRFRVVCDQATLDGLRPLVPAGFRSRMVHLTPDQLAAAPPPAGPRHTVLVTGRLTADHLSTALGLLGSDHALLLDTGELASRNEDGSLTGTAVLDAFRPIEAPVPQLTAGEVEALLQESLRTSAPTTAAAMAGLVQAAADGGAKLLPVLGLTHDPGTAADLEDLVNRLRTGVVPDPLRPTVVLVSARSADPAWPTGLRPEDLRPGAVLVLRVGELPHELQAQVSRFSDYPVVTGSPEAQSAAALANRPGVTAADALNGLRAGSQYPDLTAAPHLQAAADAELDRLTGRQDPVLAALHAVAHPAWDRKLDDLVPGGRPGRGTAAPAATQPDPLGPLTAYRTAAGLVISRRSPADLANAHLFELWPDPRKLTVVLDVPHDPATGRPDEGAAALLDHLLDQLDGGIAEGVRLLRTEVPVPSPARERYAPLLPAAGAAVAGTVPNPGMEPSAAHHRLTTVLDIGRAPFPQELAARHKVPVDTNPVNLTVDHDGVVTSDPAGPAPRRHSPYEVHAGLDQDGRLHYAFQPRDTPTAPGVTRMSVADFVRLKNSGKRSGSEKWTDPRTGTHYYSADGTAFYADRAKTVPAPGITADLLLDRTRPDRERAPVARYDVLTYKQGGKAAVVGDAMEHDHAPAGESIKRRHEKEAVMVARWMHQQDNGSWSDPADAAAFANWLATPNGRAWDQWSTTTAEGRTWRANAAVRAPASLWEVEEPAVGTSTLFGPTPYFAADKQGDAAYERANTIEIGAANSGPKVPHPDGDDHGNFSSTFRGLQQNQDTAHLPGGAQVKLQRPSMDSELPGPAFLRDVQAMLANTRVRSRADQVAQWGAYRYMFRKNVRDHEVNPWAPGWSMTGSPLTKKSAGGGVHYHPAFDATGNRVPQGLLIAEMLRQEFHDRNLHLG